MPGPTQPYQVKPTDKDMLKIAEQLGIDYNALKAANPNITSVSAGQYINVPKKYDPFQPVKDAFSQAGSALKKEANWFAGLVTQTPYGAQSNFGNLAFGANPNLPNPYGGAGNVPYGPPKPATIPLKPGIPVSSQASPYAFGPQSAPSSAYVLSHDNFLAQVQNLKNTMESATSQSQLPAVVVPSMANAAGYTPAQMLQAGYQLQNGQWIKTGAPSGDANAPKTNNNQYTNPQLHMVLHGRNAHNRRNRYWTTEAQMKNKYKRAKHGVKQAQPINEVRADTPSTTLDVILGS